MARTIAIEWDTDVAHVLVGKSSGSKLTLERAAVIPLEAHSDGKSETPAEVLARCMAEHKIGRGDVVVSVGRAGTEMRLLEVPNVPAAELPQLVRFQAMRQFSALTDDWKLDYVLKRSKEGADQIRALAAAISPQLFKQIVSGCEKNGWKVQRLLFRPFSLATLFNTLLPSDQTRLCIDPLGDEADIVVLHGNQLEMVRTVRLARDDQGAIDLDQLQGELRRTLLAYGSQPGAYSVDQIVFCGSENDLVIAETLKQKLELETTVVDPFQLIDAGGADLNSLGDAKRRFVGLIGALLETAEENPTRIDFLNPRKPPEAPTIDRQKILAGSVVALLALSIVAFAGWRIWDLNSRLKAVTLRVNNRREAHEKLVNRVEDIKKIQAFAKESEANWLEELIGISNEIPNEGIIIRSIGITRSNAEDQLGTIRIDAAASSTGYIDSMEANLRDSEHVIRQGERNADSSDPDHPWQFPLWITVKKETASSPTTQPVAAKGDGEASKPTAKADEKANGELKEEDDQKLLDSSDEDADESTESESDESQEPTPRKNVDPDEDNVASTQGRVGQG